jgi:hypothetical protein
MKQTRIVIAAAAAAAGVLFATPAVTTATPLTPIGSDALVTTVASSGVDQVAFRRPFIRGGGGHRFIGGPRFAGHRFVGDRRFFFRHRFAGNRRFFFRHRFFAGRRFFGPVFSFGYPYAYGCYDYPYAYGYGYYPCYYGYGPTIGFGY